MSCPCATPGADCPLLPFPSAQESPRRLWGLLLPEDKQSAQPGLAHGLEGHLTIRQNPSFLAGPISTLIPCTGLGTSGNCWPLPSAMHHSGILGPLRATGPAGRGQADQAWEAGEREEAHAMKPGSRSRMAPCVASRPLFLPARRAWEQGWG